MVLQEHRAGGADVHTGVYGVWPGYGRHGGFRCSKVKMEKEKNPTTKGRI